MSYKVHYFNAKGRGEIIRLILVAADQKFEDIRIDMDKWPEVKPTTPTGVLPYVETPDGHIMTQSLAIARSLAKKFNLYGKTDCDFYLVERTVEQVADIFGEFVKLMFGPAEGKEDAKKSILEGKTHAAIVQLVKFLEENKTGFFAGDGVTYADFLVIQTYDNLPKVSDTLQNDFPALKEHKEKVLNAIPSIKKWFEESKPTIF